MSAPGKRPSLRPDFIKPTQTAPSPKNSQPRFAPSLPSKEDQTDSKEAVKHSKYDFLSTDHAFMTRGKPKTALDAELMEKSKLKLQEQKRIYNEAKRQPREKKTKPGVDEKGDKHDKIDDMQKVISDAF